MKHRTLFVFLCLLLCMGSSLAASAKISNPLSVSVDGVAIFAGGCFWCMESDFEKIKGVNNVVSGYMGGHVKKPTYKAVSAGETGHAEAIRIEYDPKKISYRQLLAHFWRNIDPLTDNAQFCDHGSQYRAAIFYLNHRQKQEAQVSRETLKGSGRFSQPIVTQVVMADTFYPAESYHQDYYKKNPIRYKVYRYRCGRDKRLESLWGKESS